MSKRHWVWVWTVVGAGMIAVSAQGLVLTAKTDPQKHRGDVGKQLGKYIDCLSKVAQKCEKKGQTSGIECDLTTGTAAGTVDPKAATKFAADVVKCDTKFDPAKKAKTSDYIQIGCPGDCSAAAPGIQACNDLAAYEANVEDGGNSAGAKSQIQALGGLIETFCAAHVGMPAGTSQAVIDCATNDAKFLSKYAKGVTNCGGKCETDYKNKKGNGGPNDGPNCQVGNGGADANFTLCLSKKADKHLLKVQAPGNVSTVKTLIDTALNQAAQDLYNKDNPSVDETDTGIAVCSICGNGAREGIEECDGGDDAACSGSCNADCTCP